jgi:hypothetical protein
MNRRRYGRIDTNIYIDCLRQVVAFAPKVIIIACLRQGFCIRKTKQGNKMRRLRRRTSEGVEVWVGG